MDVVFLLILLLALPAAASASTLVVPDDQPTIQAALDLQPDTVLVRSGVYAERPTLLMNHSSRGRIVVRGEGPTAPELDGFRILVYYQQEEVIVEGFHFKGLVRLDTGDEVTEWFRFRRCEFDSSFAETWSDVYDVTGLEFSDCRIRGPLYAWAYHDITFLRNVVDGWVRIQGRNMTGVNVRDNIIRPLGTPSYSTAGLFVDGDAVSGVIHGNRITGFPQGLKVPYASDILISGNRIEGAWGTGILTGMGENVTLADNEILRCGTGMIVGARWAEVRGNVIGRSLGSGIEMELDYSSVTVSRNTIYQSGQSAIEITWVNGDVYAAFDHNIGYGNAGYGIEGAPPNATLSCNDWFGNGTGAVHPMGPAASDLAVDPLFCSLADDSVHLDAASPLIATPGCGLIGARGAGCGVPTVSVAGGAAARFLLGAIGPQPSARDVEIRFQLPYAAEIGLAIFDLNGRLVSRLADGPWAAGEHSVRWPGADAGRVPPGMYFARYRHPGGEQSRAVLRLR